MGILQLPTPLVGQSGLLPSMKLMVSSDNLATVTTAGYLNAINLDGYPIGRGDVISMLYGYDVNTGIGTYATFTVNIVNGVISLVEAVPPGGVLLTGGTPTVGHLATFSGPNSIQDGGVHGTAASKAASNASLPTLASVNGATVVGHIASFADTAGTIQDGGALGQAAVKSVSDNTKSSVASVNGATVVGNLLSAADVAGTVQDSGIAASSVQLSANIKAGISSDIGGGGAGPLVVAALGLTSASIVVAAVQSSSNPVSVVAIVAGTDQFSITFSGDPGASCIINYVAFVAPQ